MFWYLLWKLSVVLCVLQWHSPRTSEVRWSGQLILVRAFSTTHSGWHKQCFAQGNYWTYSLGLRVKTWSKAASHWCYSHDFAAFGQRSSKFFCDHRWMFSSVLSGCPKTWWSVYTFSQTMTIHLRMPVLRLRKAYEGPLSSEPRSVADYDSKTNPMWKRGIKSKKQ